MEKKLWKKWREIEAERNMNGKKMEKKKEKKKRKNNKIEMKR